MRPSISTQPNWGDFKAFTTLTRQEARFVRADVESMRLILELDGHELEFEVGGRPERLARELRARVRRPVPLVHWNGIWVVGIPLPNGHALFRALERPSKRSQIDPVRNDAAHEAST